MIPISVLDLATIREGSGVAEAFQHVREQARLAERLGYRRYWLAEHHNMTGIGSAATSVLIGHVAGATETIRVGSGGVMLPNHAPLVIAEQFGTLEALYPGRIDLGLGRAPGTDQRTAWALRRDLAGSAENFPQDVVELLAYFADPAPGQTVRAVPGAGLRVPVWLLGSSLFSAQLAAHLGLPYAFASHFAPRHLLEALRLYREHFRPSEYLQQPHAMVAMNVVAAESDEEAWHLFTSMQQQVTNLIRGTPGPLQPPIEDIRGYWRPGEEQAVQQWMTYSVVGGADSVTDGVREILELTEADELITTVRVFDPGLALRSLEILAEACESIDAPAGGDTGERAAAGGG